MRKTQKEVMEFMTAFGQDFPLYPEVPDFDTRKLRAILNLEETLELITRGFGLEVLGINATNLKDKMTEISESIVDFDDPNFKEIVDGVVDVNYVNNGIAIACGFDIDKEQAKCHESNMSKLWTEDEVAELLPLNDVTITDSGAKFDKKFIVKTNVGKIVKSPSYTEYSPDIDNLVSIAESINSDNE